MEIQFNVKSCSAFMLRSKSVELVNVGCPIKNGDSDGHDVRKNKMKIAA